MKAARSRRGPPVLIVAAGPGDSDLLTVRGHRALVEAQVVVLDADIGADVLEVIPDSAERVRVGDGVDAVPPATVPSLLIDRVAAGSRVVRLLHGDGTAFASEAEGLVAAGVAFEIVPGVTPALAAAAYAGIPTREANADSRVAILETGDGGGVDWSRLVACADTLFLRVSAPTLHRVVDGLIRGGRRRDTPAALISAPTTFEQQTVTASLGSLAAEARQSRVALPAILVVGDVVRLRPRLRWLERRPLFGRRVLVTRPRQQAASFAALLKAYGADVVTLSTIRLEPPDEWGPLDDAIKRLGAFRWVLFTSVNGVAAFRERLAQAGQDARALAGARLGAVGPETADALRRGGLRVDVLPAEYRAEGLVGALRPHVEPGVEVLLVRAAEARDVLPRELRALGARVTIAPAYRTVTEKTGADAALALLEARRIDVVTFTSSSTVRGLVSLLAPLEARRLLAGPVLAAIGPVTGATLAEHGLEATVMPREYTVPALAAAIAAHFAGTD